MTANRAVISVAIALLLAGCMAQYEDISTDPVHRELIGRDLRTTSELLVHGVTLNRSYAKRVDLCSVTPNPGFSGPELVTRQTLPIGTTLHVVAIRKCTNCLSSPQPVELLVTSPSTAFCGPAPVKIDRDLMGTSIILVPVASGGAPNDSFKPTPLRGAA